MAIKIQFKLEWLIHNKQQNLVTSNEIYSKGLDRNFSLLLIYSTIDLKKDRIFIYVLNKNIYI